MDFHAIANLWPPIDEDDLVRLADDIRERGQLETIKIYNGQVLDGRRRWLACGMARVQPITEVVYPDDPLKYAFSLNEHRRHEEPGHEAPLSPQWFDSIKQAILDSWGKTTCQKSEFLTLARCALEEIREEYD